MEIDYSKRKHESPFADEPPPIADLSFPNNSPQPPLNLSPQPGRPERSDKAAFSLFLGAFFLLAALPTAYWANYTYDVYHRNSVILQYWREHPEKIPNDLSPEQKIYSQTTRVENAKLEATLCGAGSLLLLIIAVLLLVRAYRISRRLKANKLQYQLIDPRSILMLKNRLEVRYTRFQTWLLIGLSCFFGLSALFNLKQLFSSNYTTTQDIIYKGVLFSGLILSLICAFIFLTIRAKRQAARYFDASGIMRGDGQFFAWNEFRGVVTKTAINRYGGRHVWRVELALANGENAWLIPRRIKNSAEVFAFVNALPPAVLKDAG